MTARPSRCPVAFLIAMLLLLISEAILCLPKRSHPQVLPTKATA